MRSFLSTPIAARAAILLAVSIIAAPGTARAHAQLEHADPKVGSTVAGSPEQVRIWFDAELEPAFSTIEVQGAGGTVNIGSARVDPSDPRLLEVSVRPLTPGSYRVVWSVVSRDGHRTSGDYHFLVK